MLLFPTIALLAILLMALAEFVARLRRRSRSRRVIRRLAAYRLR